MFAAFTRFFSCRFFVITSSSQDNTIAHAISASFLLFCVVVGGGFCLSVSRVSAIASRSRFCGGGVASLGFVLIGTLCFTDRFVYAFVLLSDVGSVLIEGLCSLD